MSQTIQYAIDKETGAVISRVDSEVALDILQYEKMKPENNFATEYELEKISVYTLAPRWSLYKWTRKIPLAVKNRHREFWGMKPLKREPNSHELTALWKDVRYEYAGEIFSVIKVVVDKEKRRNSIVILKNETRNTKVEDKYFDGMVSWLKTVPDSIIKKG